MSKLKNSDYIIFIQLEMCPLNILNPAVNNLQQLKLIEYFVFDPGFYSFDSDKDCKIVNYYSSAVETRKKQFSISRDVSNDCSGF